MGKINLEELAGGALQEKFDAALESVLENMIDPNTPWKNKRGVTVKITFQQNEDRDDVSVDVAVETKLAAVKPIGTRMSIGRDLRTGELFAEEYGSQVRGQMSLDDLQPQKPEQETVEETETENKVVDMRTAR